MILPQTFIDIAPYVALAALAVALLLLVLMLALWTSVRRLRRAQTVVLGQHEQRDIVQHVENLDAHVRNMREAVEILTRGVDTLTQRHDATISNHAIVRFDAFGDVGGRQSTAVALLDNHRSGVVFSSIAARDFARVYVKRVENGVADRDLSPEELDAMAAAVPQLTLSPSAVDRGNAASAAHARSGAAPGPSAPRPAAAGGAGGAEGRRARPD